MVDQLIDQHEQVTLQLHNHLEAENSILLKPEYESFKHLIETLQQEEREATKIHNVLKSWHVHYGDVYQQLSKSIDTLVELYKVQQIAIDDLLQQQI